MFCGKTRLNVPVYALLRRVVALAIGVAIQLAHLHLVNSHRIDVLFQLRGQDAGGHRRIYSASSVPALNSNQIFWCAALVHRAINFRSILWSCFTTNACSQGQGISAMDKNVKVFDGLFLCGLLYLQAMLISSRW